MFGSNVPIGIERK